MSERRDIDQLIVGGSLDGDVFLRAKDWQWTLTPDEARWLADTLYEYAGTARG